ncbi:hypothetical protein E4T42_09201 [Aureobasidium subglaciale]|nr:hypothetical protein E4T42_09201 [Aureobasidium subglaciale]
MSKAQAFEQMESGMKPSQPSAPPPEYTRQDPTPSTLSVLLGPLADSTIPNHQPNAQSQAQAGIPEREYYSKLSTTTTTAIPDYARPPSPAPSTQTTASTILPTYAQTGSYKGFPSEAAYMAALTEWAETKKYIQPSEEGQTLTGFFGCKTMDEYHDGMKTQKGEGQTAARKQSQGQAERQGFMGFLRKMAKKDEGGGHGGE